MLSAEAVRDHLQAYLEPFLERDLVSAGAVQSLEVEAGRVRLALRLGFPLEGYREALAEAVTAHLRALPGVEALALDLDWAVVPHAVQKSATRLSGVKNILAVASGKGGVGKSTVAANLALALARAGARVGLLDADIYGPSQTRMMGLRDRPQPRPDQKLEPPRAYGVKCMSIGLMIDEETPMIWRGPMVTQALVQLLTETHWDDLDYLVVDLPPGTGDVQLTLVQRVPVSGALIVTTPQDIALLDARKALKMFEKVNVAVLGVIENMSVFVCPHCGQPSEVFGRGGAARMAEQYGVPLLGALPLDAAIREQADGGRPTVVADPDGEAARRFVDIARRAAARLSLRGKDYSARFPRIVVKND